MVLRPFYEFILLGLVVSLRFWDTSCGQNSQFGGFRVVLNTFNGVYFPKPTMFASSIVLLGNTPLVGWKQHIPKCK